MESGDYEQAIEVLTKAIANVPDYALLYDYRGIAQALRDELEATIADFKMTIQLDDSCAGFESDY